VPSVPAFLVARAEKTLAHLCLIAWRREVHSRQSVCKVLQPTWAAEARHLLRRTWVLWRPLGRLQRQKATLSKLASANIEREASAFLRRVLVAWREKVALSHSGSASKGDHASVGTVPLLGGPEAVLRPNNKAELQMRSGMAASSNRQHPLSHWTCPKRSRTAFYEKATRHRRHRHRHAGVPCQELRRSLMCSLRKKGSKKQQRWLRFRAPSYQLHGRVEFNGGQLCGQSRGTLVAQDCNGPVNAIT
ncbi:unnamed protein product, partial [Durusdinium trenchii]